MAGHIHHVSITTGDLARAKWFYGDVLGFRLRAEGEDASPALSELVGIDGARIRWIEFHVGSGQILELLEYVHPSGVPLVQRSCDPVSAHVAFEVDDIDATYDALVRAGVTVRSAPVLLEEAGDWRGFRCMYALDPDGFTIEFVQPPTAPARER